MSFYQPEVAGVVVDFVSRPQDSAYLTPIDRMDINRWREPARLAGYDRMVIHHREPGDCTEIGDFVSLYRSGEPWSRWGFARSGSSVNAWCCLSGNDIGSFPSLAAAFQGVLRCVPGSEANALFEVGSGVVMDFMTRLRRPASARLGSAA
jgi:hypothetical protein